MWRQTGCGHGGCLKAQTFASENAGKCVFSCFFARRGIVYFGASFIGDLQSAREETLGRHDFLIEIDASHAGARSEK